MNPPSVERWMATLVQLTGAAVVLATFHVTACAVLPVQETAVFGEVTWNGPAAVVTLKVTLAELTPPPPIRLSRAVRR